MKRGLVAPVFLAAAFLGRAAAASDTDPWFGSDKALHFGISAVLAGGGYAVSSVWLDTRAERALSGSAFSLTLGAGKELWDLSGHGDPSWRDFTWDVIGTALGTAIALGVDTLANPKNGSRVHASAQGLVLRF